MFYRSRHPKPQRMQRRICRKFPPRRVEHSFEFLGDLPDTGSEIDRLPGLVGFGFRRWADEVSGFVLDGIR